MNNMLSTTVPIRPGVKVLSVLRHLNYKPWYAIAEFVDNAVQSYLSNKARLRELHGDGHKLRVYIELDQYDNGRLRVRDNAAGISEADYPRAFRPAEAPPDSTGLSEYGMGMKSAACWFSPRFSVGSKALNERVERTVVLDVNKVVTEELDELEVQVCAAPLESHYTEITLYDLYKVPHGRTVGKIKEHLASIYRKFIREGELELIFDGEPLSHTLPMVLVAPLYKEPSEQPREWRREFDLDLGMGMRAHGFAAIRERGSTSEAGFALLRRNRVIEGSADDGYRPEAIFGKPNSFRYQRVFGEIHLEGFKTSHTKDGVMWDETEEAFLELLRECLDDDSFPLLRQAEEHRMKVSPRHIQKTADKATKSTAKAIEEKAGPLISKQLEQAGEEKPDPDLIPVSAVSRRQLEVDLNGSTWQIELELSSEPGIGDWLSLSDKDSDDGSSRSIKLRVSLDHPFMTKFVGASYESLEPLIRVAAAIGLGEAAARNSGVKLAGTIRRNVNELLRDALSNCA